MMTMNDDKDTHDGDGDGDAGGDGEGTKTYNKGIIVSALCQSQFQGDKNIHTPCGESPGSWPGKNHHEAFCASKPWRWLILNSLGFKRPKI